MLLSDYKDDTKNSGVPQQYNINIRDKEKNRISPTFLYCQL